MTLLDDGRLQVENPWGEWGKKRAEVWVSDVKAVRTRRGFASWHLELLGADGTVLGRVGVTRGDGTAKQVVEMAAEWIRRIALTQTEGIAMTSEGQSRIGELSADGKWQWDGTTWQPVAPAQSPPELGSAPAPTKPRRRWLGYGVVAIVCLITGMVIGNCTSGSSGQSTATKSTPPPTAASSSPSTSSLAATYMGVALPHIDRLSAAYGKMSTDCGSGNVTVCRAAVNAASNETTSFVNDLSKLAVPSCLGPAHLELGTALELAIDATTAVIAGIDANDTTQVLQGARLIDLSNTHLRKAADHLRSARCG